MLGFVMGVLSDVGRGGGISMDGYTDSLTVTLSPIVQPGVNAAPSAVWFEVADVTGCAAGAPTGVRIPKFHDITYVWDFGDAARATPSNAAALNMPAAWKDINRAYGMKVTHVFNDPGTFTVTVTAYEPATRRKGSATVSVTVGDPGAVFPGPRTIIYNPGNAVDVRPYGYTRYAHVTTNWAAVTKARNTVGAQTAQILIAPGVTIPETRLVDSPSWANIRIGALDPDGAMPVIGPITDETLNVIKDNNPSANVERVVFGLRFVGDWDSTTETGRVVRPFNTFDPASGMTYLAMQHRCEFDGWEAVTGGTGNIDDHTFYLCHSELVVTNWQNYGLHGSNRFEGHTAVIACSVFQHPDALSGGSKDSGFYNNHGPLRDFGSKTIYIGVCDLFSRNGWSTGGTLPADGLDITSDQACIRLNTQGVTGRTGSVERVALEGMVWIEEQDSSNADVPGNYVFDKFLQVMGPRTLQEGNEIRYGGCTFRNGLGVILNRPAAQTNTVKRWFYLSNEDGTADNDAGIDIHNCTLVDLRTNTNAGDETLALTLDDTDPGEAFLNQAVENNVIHQPNRSPAIVPDNPLDLVTGMGFAPRHKGPRVGFLYESGTLVASVAQSAYFTLAYADVKTTRYNQSLTDSGSATDQAYWTANAGAKHKLIMDSATLHAQEADFEVTFAASEIRVWNRTGAAWAAGTAWQLMLDRAAAIPGFDPAASTVGETVPLARPQAGSAAIGTGDAGLRAYDDFLGTVRPVAGNARGALLPG